MVIGVAFTLLIASISITLAFFTDKKETIVEIEAGTVGVRLEETFPEFDQYGVPIDTAKIFEGVSTGTKRANVRARVFCSLEYEVTFSEWRPLPIPSSSYSLIYDAPDWVNGKDGYWYYKNILSPAGSAGDRTGQFRVMVDSMDIPDTYSGKKIRLNMKVEIEAAQATNGEYKKVFDIIKLPDGVSSIN